MGSFLDGLNPFTNNSAAFSVIYWSITVEFFGKMILNLSHQRFHIIRGFCVQSGNKLGDPEVVVLMYCVRIRKEFSAHLPSSFQVRGLERALLFPHFLKLTARLR